MWRTEEKIDRTPIVNIRNEISTLPLVVMVVIVCVLMIASVALGYWMGTMDIR